jgi:hypothetical protein
MRYPVRVSVRHPKGFVIFLRLLANPSPELIPSPFPYPKLASIPQHLLYVGDVSSSVSCSWCYI